jgi:molybdopterin converting factor small subunit
MSFLDAMTCGFGAIILFFMIIAANIDVRRDTELDDLTSQVSRMEVRLLASRNNLVLRREELSDELQAAAVLEGLRSNLLAEIRSTEEESEDIAEDDAARQAAGGARGPQDGDGTAQGGEHYA